MLSFDTIPHDQLLACLRMRITDRSVLHLVQMWLHSPVQERDDAGRTTTTRPTQGTPQGGVISPLLANIYLHWFEKAFHRPDGPATWAKAKLVRYADDFVVLARYVSDRLHTWIESQLEGRFRLTINRKKTRVVNLRQPGAALDFLGFTFRYDRDLRGRDHRYLNVFPSRKSLARLRDRLREITGPQWGWKPVPELIGEGIAISAVGDNTSGTVFPPRRFMPSTSLSWIACSVTCVVAVSVASAGRQTKPGTPFCSPSDCSCCPPVSRRHCARLTLNDLG